ncbi:Zn-dependent hydrolase [Vibrio sp. MEBiC08052]|uniref:Zn-dependent hydrolase n=1 Tax=Vibrio sp. MEBiC08052 TaxID=1761910 RepID=UPI0007406C35|nr:Zn-dependent hydrolase [Vibrio sp. MEBiC08052]KUI97300.1 allantoate amidohydrolase [Vibrio sp. MEBiC08052]
MNTLSPNSLRINASRLLQFISEMAQIGASPNGGCNRQALTDLDRQGRALFLDWCEAIGGQPRLDSMGNLFVRFRGDNDALEPILMGSHLDTQPTGGKYDGVYGVLAALEVMTTLADSNMTLPHPVEIVVWSNEEGARFSPAMSGSGVFAGKLKQADVYRSSDDNGVSYLDALTRSQQLGAIPCQAFPFKAALELHIEQGPILEAERKTIGVVSGVQGMNWYQVTLSGESVHAGPTPMQMRKDPVQGMTRVLSKLFSKTAEYGEAARLTVGKIATYPSSPNTVPERVTFTLDVRHPNQAELDALSREILALCQSAARPLRLSCDIEVLWQSPAVAFDAQCIDAIQTAADQLALDSMPIVSGAGHDSVYLSGIGPTAMIFVPCKDGISHNEKEHTEPAQLVAGANVLLHSLIQLSA